jgi:hypothetical protein
MSEEAKNKLLALLSYLYAAARMAESQGLAKLAIDRPTSFRVETGAIGDAAARAFAKWACGGGIVEGRDGD